MNLILKHEQFFFIGLCLYIFRNFIIYTEVNHYVPSLLLIFLLWTAEASWCTSIIMKFHNKGKFILISILLLFGFINGVITESWNILALYSMVTASKDIDIKKIIYFIFKISFFFLMIDISWYCINYLVGNVSISQTREIDGEIVARHKFYFNNANGFSMYFLFTILMYIYVKYESMARWKIYGILVVATIFIYIFPNTRTMTILSVAFILLTIPTEGVVRKICDWICSNMFIIATVLVFVIVVVFINNPYSEISILINQMMNGRLTMVAGTLERYSLKAFGQAIINEKVFSPKFGYYTLYIDNFYAMLLIRYGIVAFLVFAIAAIATGKKLLRYGKSLELVLFAVVFIYGMSESTALDIYPVFPLLFMRDVWEDKKV